MGKTLDECAMELYGTTYDNLGWFGKAVAETYQQECEEVEAEQD